MVTTCPNCGETFQRIGTHWRYNPDHRPELSEYQKEVVTGLLMGDGHLNRSGSTPRLRVSSIQKEYLLHLDQETFPSIGNGVSLSKTAKELADRNKESGRFETVNESQYNDVYWWETSVHPDLSTFSSWYTDEGKVFPESIELSSTTLTHWYVGDGTLDDRWNPRILIAASNECRNKDKLTYYFRSSMLPEPNFSETKRSDGTTRMNMMWDTDQSQRLFGHMTDPVPGFEYKWPDRYK